LRQEDKKYFDHLKKDIVATMQRSQPGINPSISNWKGQDITDFQEELLMKTKGQISEKWFYNHFKAESQSLPRIDVLNLLCRYAGYSNWDDFKFRNSELVQNKQVLVRPNRLFITVPLAAVVLLIIFYGLFKLANTRQYTFSFYDADTKEPVNHSIIEIIILSDDESPVSFISDTLGHVRIKTDKSMIRMIVRSQYYKNDTVTRILKKFNTSEKIGLHVNDYALMIRYFSEMNVDNWQQRRNQLDLIFDDNAIIYQVHKEKNGPGMALYNKQEFIDKLTMPTGSLRQIEVLDTKYFHDRIMVLRFRVNSHQP
jgi:hypothetical protein